MLLQSLFYINLSGGSDHYYAFSLCYQYLAKLMADCSLVANSCKTILFSPPLISHYLQLDRAEQQ